MADILDFELMNALQLAPRIPWAQLAPILNSDPSTLSRRWHRLVDDHVVWTTCVYAAVPAHGSQVPLEMRVRGAIVEIVCAPGRREAVIRAMSELSHISSVHCTSGARDLYLTIFAPGLLAIDRYVDGLGDVIDGILATRTHYIRTTFQDGASWRLNALAPRQRRALEASLPDPIARAVPTRAHLELIEALSRDVRRPVSAVSAEFGKSLAAVSRGIDTLLGAPWVRWRVDFAHNLVGWDASATIWLAVPQAELEKVAASLCLLPQVRWCASVAGPANLMASLWLRDLDELDDIEGKLTKVFPRLTITDRWLTPRIAKRLGNVLDDSGRWERFVPTNVGDYAVG
ncbi:Lrp/AsnC family transcriptional regulator [Agromyces archimandritae]|uniref:Lrp/AsnC family transcriptional regulator n=1 Tax=Agromyces archimandritae TaxID=2781962 RepID=A0A975FKN3_9MICO|nr:Lrp/AsnC family transcriptional regulator [Agromyces archimandritae]QTX03834.1 Lrp/AsnC family transcriptional regulator [Agromyces archimandritae]